MSSTLSIPRTLLRSLAGRATQSPIEVIVSIFIIVTLAYFQLLHAITTSNFFEPFNAEARGLAETSATGTESSNFSGFWEGDSSVGGLIFVRKAHSDQWLALSENNGDIIASAEGSKRFIVEPVLLADSEENPSSLLSNLAYSIQSQLFQPISTEHDIVPSYALKDSELNLSGYGFGRISNHLVSFPNQRKKLLEQSNDEPFLQQIVNQSVKKAELDTYNASRLGLQLITIVPDDDMHNYFPPSRLEELRSVRWVAYAVRALVMRIWALVQVSKRDSLLCSSRSTLTLLLLFDSSELTRQISLSC